MDYIDGRGGLIIVEHVGIIGKRHQTRRVPRHREKAPRREMRRCIAVGHRRDPSRSGRHQTRIDVGRGQPRDGHRADDVRDEGAEIAARTTRFLEDRERSLRVVEYGLSPVSCAKALKVPQASEGGHYG